MNHTQHCLSCPTAHACPACTTQPPQPQICTRTRARTPMPPAHQGRRVATGAAGHLQIYQDIPRIIPVYTSLYQSIPVHTSIYQSIPVYTSIYQSIPVNTSIYQYIPVRTRSASQRAQSPFSHSQDHARRCEIKNSLYTLTATEQNYSPGLPAAQPRKRVPPCASRPLGGGGAPPPPRKRLEGRLTERNTRCIRTRLT